MQRLLYSVVGALVMVVAGWLGGWPWALLGALAFLIQARSDTRPAAAFALAGPALFWIAMFHWTGDRRLFFPFAVHMGQASRPVLILAVFFAIRVQQAATLQVLAVEFLVTVAVLWAGRAIYRQGPPGLPMRTLAAAVASILALIGLLL